jgi:hypothetical protein
MMAVISTLTLYLRRLRYPLREIRIVVVQVLELIAILVPPHRLGVTDPGVVPDELLTGLRSGLARSPRRGHFRRRIKLRSPQITNLFDAIRYRSDTTQGVQRVRYRVRFNRRRYSPPFLCQCALPRRDDVYPA